MGQGKQLDMTPAKADSLRRAYDDAIKGGKKREDSFVWQGSELVVGYAYYLLEYLSGEYDKPSLKPAQRPPE